MGSGAAGWEVEEGDGGDEDEEDEGLDGERAEEEVLVAEAGNEDCEDLEDAAGARSSAGRRGGTVGDFGVYAKGAVGERSLASDEAFIGDTFFEFLPYLGAAGEGFESSPEEMSRDACLAFAGGGRGNAFK